LLEPGTVKWLTFEVSGCRTVQLALDKADRGTAARLAADLAGSVLEAIRSPFGNHVVQKIIEVLSPGEVPFLLEEIDNGGVDLACHEYGCRVLCRLLEYLSHHAGVTMLVDKVLQKTEWLVGHKFGHHVVESCLEYGQSYQRQRVLKGLKRSLRRHVQSRNAAFVVVKALAVADGADLEELVQQLLEELPTPGDLARLIKGIPGNMVGRALLQHAGPEHLQRIATLWASTSQGRPPATKKEQSFGSKLSRALAPGTHATRASEAA